MIKRHQTNTKKQRPKQRPESKTRASRKISPFGRAVALTRGTVADQTVLLNHPDLPLVQRQALAAEIGRVQGNGHLQRVLASRWGTEQTLEQHHGSRLKRIQRQAKGGTPAATGQAVTTRAQAEAVLQQRWGVGKVTEGTLESQVKEISTMNSQQLRAEAPPPEVETMINEAGWQAWAPPDGSKVWGWLVNAFEDFSRTFGSVPQVREIVFYETAYRFIPSARGGPKLEPKPSEHASFSGGQLLINHVAESAAPNRGLPAGRTKESQKETITPKTTTEAGFRFTMVHELGHGLLEAKIRDDMQKNKSSQAFMNEYSSYVGWYSGLLYDAGVEAVRNAIDKDEVPSYKHRISGRWGEGKWKEQPITEYMTISPDEDFAEAVATYITRPQLLEQRSPRRYEFIHTRLESFRQVLQQRLSSKTGQ